MDVLGKSVLIRSAAVLFVSVLLASSDNAQAQFQLTNAFPALGFEVPVDLAADGQGYLYVVERAGRIYRIPNDSTTTEKELFLDITENVYQEAGEQEIGLLGLVFHPQHEDNGYFYIYYTAPDPLRSVVSRLQRTEDDPAVADPESEHVILEVNQPTPRHNAGDLNFDADGNLLISVGDGSMGGDTYGNGQNPTTLLGSILRIDVDNPSDGRAYGIPDDNPFVDNADGYAEEIYAYGFRNPWRFSIDPVTGDVWAGDVGETSWEEIDFVVKGGNHGWPIVEGPSCYQPTQDCARDNLVPPVHAYSHDVGRSAIGGFVYRGETVPELQGKYIFADWANKQIYALSYTGSSPIGEDSDVLVEEVVNMGQFISGFGVDEDNELYMLSTFANGEIFRFAATTPSNTDPPETPEIEQFQFVLAGPNPFRNQTSYDASVPAPTHLRVVVYDLLGRTVDVLFDSAVQGGTEHQISFDGESLPNGVYVVDARTTHQSITKKVILAR